MKWEEPVDPDGNTGNKYGKQADELRENPGKWGVVTSFPVSEEDPGKDALPARNVTYDINRGRYISYRPRGAFKAVSRMGYDEDGNRVVKVHARYIGKNGEYDT